MTSLQPPVVAGERPKTIYNKTFWLAYLANVLLVTANALTFRFAEFVKWLGGTESLTGQIVSVGIVGSLIVRFTLGRDIDGHGVRRMWIGCSTLFILGAGLMTITQSLDWQIYAARAAFTVGLASMFACSISHIQAQVPPHRRTEVLGSLGSSGFVGMILGAQMGDLIFLSIPMSRAVFIALFGGTTFCGLLYLMLVLIITQRDEHTRPHETPAAHKLIFRYWPGPVVFVALMMGVGFVVTTVFLTRHATELGLPGIRTFFTAYPASAFVVRMISRTWSRSMGRHRMILLGLAGHALGHLWLCRVTTEWDLIIPAIGCGFGHALLFPCVVSLGAGAFPPEYRGSGTTITLGFMDLGVFISAPILGRVIDTYGFNAMFLTSAGTAIAIGLFYAVRTFGLTDADSDSVTLDRPVQPSIAAETESSPEPVLVCADEAGLME
ncbi:MAG: MFS transporter [Planctomycetaceae bacterium]|nr:MFS transporter [Planctomycetaceae bacterium]